MDAQSLIALVEQYVSDGSDFADATALSYLNQGMTVVAGGGDRPYSLPPLAPLPDLLTTDTVTLAADAQSVSMPSDYQRGCVAVIDANGDELTLCQSYYDFVKKYPELETGSTEHYFIRGNTLFYSPAKAQDVTVHYYKFPTDMTDSSSSYPDGLPAQFHEKILCNYAAWIYYKQIEDSMDNGGRNNTAYYYNAYMAGLTDLERFFGPEEKGCEQVSDDSDYIGYGGWL